MNSQGTLNSSGLPLDFEAEYSRVEQYDDHSCLFAAIAMVSGITAQEVREVAVVNGHIPSHGSFAIVDDGSLAAFLAGHHGWVASVWKEVATTYQLPDLAILLIEVTEKFPGRHVLFARERNRAGQPNVEYIVDPGYWIEPSRQVRAIQDKELSWFISLHPMADSDY